MIKPRQPVPSLDVTLSDGTAWALGDQTPENFTLIAFYRGLHCPQCARWTASLAGLRPEFEERGVSVLAASTDPIDRAGRAVTEWGLGDLPVGADVSVDKAREWGLFISSGRGATSAGIDEPERFNEPGVFLVRPNQTLYAAWIQSTPFARIRFDDLLEAVDKIIRNDYPARGEAA